MSRRHWQLDARRWQATRRAVFQRDGWRCVECGRFGRLECDHIRALADYPGQDPYALDGLQSLCRNCHLDKTAGERRGRHMSPERAAWRHFIAKRLKSDIPD